MSDGYSLSLPDPHRARQPMAELGADPLRVEAWPEALSVIA